MSDHSEKRKMIKELQAIPAILIVIGIFALFGHHANWWWIPTFAGIFISIGLKCWLFELQNH